jgi:C4-dicarboxylate-specific signal transduction histidine kinase
MSVLANSLPQTATHGEAATSISFSKLGVLAASIAHEVNQPLSGIITNASTCLRMLASDPPDILGAIETARRTIRDGNRASEVVTQLRALFSNKDANTEPVDLNEAAREVIALSCDELKRNRVILRSELRDDLPPVAAVRVQLQQVILNLIRNASDAMRDTEDRPRLLLIRTTQDEDDSVRLTVEDSGVGLDTQTTERLFEEFYTTKSNGMGIGLSVSRSIVERFHGRMWAMRNSGPGSSFSFSIPCCPKKIEETPRRVNLKKPDMDSNDFGTLLLFEPGSIFEN